MDIKQQEGCKPPSFKVAENSLSDSLTCLSDLAELIFEFPVGDGDQKAYFIADMNVDYQRLKDRIALKLNVKQVNFGVRDSGQNTELLSYIDEVVIEIIPGEWMKSGNVRVKPNAGMVEKEIAVSFATTCTAQCSPINPLGLSFGVHITRGVTTVHKACGWKVDDIDHDNGSVKRTWEVWRFDNGRRITSVYLGTTPELPFNPKSIAYQSEDIKAEDVWEAKNTDNMEKFQAIEWTIKVDLHTARFRKVFPWVYAKSKGRVHSYKGSLIFYPSNRKLCLKQRTPLCSV